jgi:anthranilate phosphoribosyltransferase
MAEALSRLGTKKSWIVHGKDGLDEISISGTTIIAEVEGGIVRDLEVHPTDCYMNIESMDGFSVSNASESAEIVRGILGYKMRESAAESMVLINAMAAFYLTGHAETIGDALGYAFDSIRNGHALKKLSQLSIAEQ